MLVEAGPDQAATWRSNDSWSLRGALPEVMFPGDRSWLVSTLWDDDWTCIGGPAQLIDKGRRDGRLQGRLVQPGQDATPPGYQSR